MKKLGLRTPYDAYVEFEAYGDMLMNSKIDFKEMFFSEKDRPSYGNTFLP